MSLHLKRFMAAAFLLTSVPAIAQTPQECAPNNMPFCDGAVEDPFVPLWKHAEALTNRAMAYLEQGKYREAIADSGKAVALTPEDVVPLFIYGIANADLALRDKPPGRESHSFAAAARKALTKVAYITRDQKSSPYYLESMLRMKRLKSIMHRTTYSHGASATVGLTLK